MGEVTKKELGGRWSPGMWFRGPQSNLILELLAVIFPKKKRLLGNVHTNTPETKPNQPKQR